MLERPQNKGDWNLTLLRDLIYDGLLATKIRLAELNCKTPTDYFRMIQRIKVSSGIRSLSMTQKENEIVPLLDHAARKTIRAACEIGTGRGGTTYLLAKVVQPKATLITVDLTNNWRNALLLRSLAGARRKLHVISGDSKSPSTFQRIAGLLNNQSLDLLFIDGDHSRIGVESDFQLYSKLVQRGGWIVLHDIIFDHRTRFGVETEACSGDVPVFWNQIKNRYSHYEIVEDYQQDGFGIGVIEV